MALPTKYVPVNGTAMHYFHTGRTTLPGVTPDFTRGEVLLFIHGAGSNAHTWHRQLAAFAGAHSPLAPDLPGHGRSGGTESLGSIDGYGDCVAGFMAALRLRRAVLVGRSMGGAIALRLALTHPDRVRALVLVATATRFELPPTLLETWRAVMQGRAQQPFTADAFSPAADFAVVRDAWMEQVKTDPRVRYGDLVACNAFDGTAALAAVRVPTLVVAGRDDRIAPPERSDALHRAIPGSQLVVIEHAGHTIPAERPEEFNAALAGFLETLPADTAHGGVA